MCFLNNFAIKICAGLFFAEYPIVIFKAPTEAGNEYIAETNLTVFSDEHRAYEAAEEAAPEAAAAPLAGVEGAAVPAAGAAAPAAGAAPAAAPAAKK